MVATLTFRKQGRGEWGTTFTVSGEIYVIWRNETGEQLGPTTKGFALEDVIQEEVGSIPAFCAAKLETV